MRRLLSATALLLSTAVVVVATALVGSVVPAQAFVDKDCGDFATQAAAQVFFLGAGPGDPHRLDAEGDGLACESNPCPCTGSAPVPLVGQTTAPTPTPTPQAEPGTSVASGPVQRHAGNVVGVTDGDTLKVRVHGVGIRDVRILGIDTPEVHGTRECGGRDASARMAALAPVGSRVVLASDSSQADRDRYGRWLRYVARGGRDVGRAQVHAGLATTYVYRGNPFARTRDYRRVERLAQRSGRGSWSRCWS